VLVCSGVVRAGVRGGVLRRMDPSESARGPCLHGRARRAGRTVQVGGRSPEGSIVGAPSDEQLLGNRCSLPELRGREATAYLPAGIRPCRGLPADAQCVYEPAVPGGGAHHEHTTAGSPAPLPSSANDYQGVMMARRTLLEHADIHSSRRPSSWVSTSSTRPTCIPWGAARKSSAAH
jgi:hypothetical protein